MFKLLAESREGFPYEYGGFRMKFVMTERTSIVFYDEEEKRYLIFTRFDRELDDRLKSDVMLLNENVLFVEGRWIVQSFDKLKNVRRAIRRIHSNFSKYIKERIYHKHKALEEILGTF